MNWLRNSPIRVSLRGRGPSSSPPKECDPAACFESFKHHWQQALSIINKIQGGTEGPTQDDILAVVNNLDQMQGLLVLEQKTPNSRNMHECLDFLLSQNILDQLLTSSSLTGLYSNILKLEQLKMYEMLLSNAPQQQLLTHEPFLRPLLRLLTSCINECFPADIEKRLILLLNQLCVCLTQHPNYLDLFFTESQGPGRFVIFSLLIPYVHREGGIGHQARDAMLLCMTLSKNHDVLGAYIAEKSNVCPVLATGLSGLYSRLPRKIQIETDDWHCFTPDDVIEMPELTLFLSLLEFCNAVVQVAHPLVHAQMLEFVHHGFLVPVVGPALLQNMTEELLVSTAYLELFLRSITEPGLLKIFLRFLIVDHYDGERVIDKLISRLGTKDQLCLATIALFNTLVSLNCEDVMLELIFKYLISCSHVMLSQRKRIKDIDVYCKSAEKFLSLSPSCITNPGEKRRKSSGSSSHSESKSLPTSSTSSSRTSDSLHGNFSAYLISARKNITSCSEACKSWTHLYDGESPLPCKAVAIDSNRNFTKPKDESLPSISSGYESFPLPRSRDSSPEPKESLSNENNLVSRDSGFSGTVAKPLSFTNSFHTTPDIGPFLDLLLRQLENMMTNSLYLNLQLTGLISRLAAYSQPLLLSLLLNHSLVFQPSVRSLFQVLGSLKQRLDSYLSRHDNVDRVLRDAKSFLVHREESIVNIKKVPQDSVTNYAPSTVNGGSRKGGSIADSSYKGEGRRLSFSSAFSVLKGAFSPVREQPAIEYSANGFRFTKKVEKENTELRNVVMCALVFDEWLKELAALALEHVACYEVPMPKK
ncbi:FHIP family protein GI14169 isoform X2 [Neocloeon triangulifer]|uniref:FHIP family protein GI14169 isoform X2 n=1 Tax=Neocloeon triangulifer TaxID=2078957 RepID=UPI00286ECE58|nr:FHIP family protein GI14169 isoform X2 [Neocloeon triangulifer]